MKVDGGFGLASASLGGQVDDEARPFEEAGYDGIWSAETSHDPFLPLACAARATERVELGTGIAVAFARNPMTVANIAYDLQALLGGPVHPRARLADQAAHHQALLDAVVRARRPHAGVHPRHPRHLGLLERRHASSTSAATSTRHTLMTPFFDPGPNPLRHRPRLPRRRSGERMTEVAGEVCDGFLCHAFTTEDYLREVTMPALERGLAKAGRAPVDLRDRGPAFVVTGTDEEAMAASARRRAPADRLLRLDARPTGRCSSSTAGATLQDELNRLSKEGKWKEMGDLIDDEILRRVRRGRRARRRWPPRCTPAGATSSTACSFYAPYQTDPDTWLPVIEALKSA